MRTGSSFELTLRLVACLVETAVKLLVLVLPEFFNAFKQLLPWDAKTVDMILPVRRLMDLFDTGIQGLTAKEPIKAASGTNRIRLI